MDSKGTKKDETGFSHLPTQELELILSKVLKEMRRRDSNHLKGDAIATSQALRLFRKSGKLS